MTQEELKIITDLQKEVADLKLLLNKDEYSNLKVFRKKVQFLTNVSLTTVDDITKISKTGGTAPIADGTHTKSIPVGGGSINIVTVNGIITNIT